MEGNLLKFGPVGTALGALLASVAHVQAPIGSPDAEGASGAGAGEIIVTAQRKSENPQKTPIAVPAVTAEVVQNLDLADFKDIAAIMPGARFTTQAGCRAP